MPFTCHTRLPLQIPAMARRTWKTLDLLSTTGEGGGPGVLGSNQPGYPPYAALMSLTASAVGRPTRC